MDYWRECVEIALEDAGIKASDEQVKIIKEIVEGGHENYGMAYGYDEIGKGFEDSKINKLERELEKERSKLICPKCKGQGRLTSHGPYHNSNSQCYKCRGEGLVLP